MIYGMGMSPSELAALRDHDRRVNDHYARELGAADLESLDMDRTQLVQPGGGGASTAPRLAKITGYFDGAFPSAPNSGFRAKYLDANGQPTGSDLNVYVFSYDDTVGQYGRVALTSSNADPDWRVDDVVSVVTAEYAGQMRVCLAWPVRRVC